MIAEGRPAFIGMIVRSRIEDQRQRRFVTGSQELLPRARQLVAERDRSAARQAADPCRIFTPAMTVADCDDGIHIVQFWTPVRSARPCVVMRRIRQVCSGGCVSPPGRLNGTRVRRCGEA